MSTLGIYFGLKAITVVETKGHKVSNHFAFSRSLFSSEGQLEEKTPDTIKIVTIFKDEIRKNKISSKEATICLSGRDLIIRNFEIPVLPPEEMRNAIMFEAKKYIPFKVEELVFDFQVQLDKVSRRNLVLFAGVKKEVLDKYLSTLSQLNFKVNAIEYAAFSVLRFIQLAGAAGKGVVGVLSTDFEEEDEIHFTILENGFPLFSRDITLIGRAEGLGATEKLDIAKVLDKLKTEIHISLDYYDRKLPTKNIETAFLLCSGEHRQTLEAVIKEMGLSVHFIEAHPHLPPAIPFNLSFIKSYSCSLSKSVKGKFTIDLLSAKDRAAKVSREAAAGEGLALLSGIKLSPVALLIGVCILGGTFAYGKYRESPLKATLNQLLAARPAVAGVKAEASAPELEQINTGFKDKAGVMEGFINRRVYLTHHLDLIPRAIPEGVWLTDLSYKENENRIELELRGIARVGDSDKELKLVNKFLNNLKANPTFAKNFKEASIVVIGRAIVDGKVSGTGFDIMARGGG
jgi:hypothetical protein